MMASDAGSEAQAGTGVGSSKSVPSSAPARSTSSPVRRKPSVSTFRATMASLSPVRAGGRVSNLRPRAAPFRSGSGGWRGRRWVQPQRHQG